MRYHSAQRTRFVHAGFVLAATALAMELLMTPDARAEEKSVKIASAQIFCFDGDRSGNLVRIENAIKRAKADGAQLVAFPESCLLGWVNPDAHTRACPIPGEDSAVICEFAKKYSIFINIGIDEKEGDALFDSSILIDDTGKILLKHRKNNVLPELMTPPYATGSGVEAVDTKLGRIGVMICADSFRKALLNQMKDLKPEFVLIPYGWAATETEWPDHGKELQKTVQNAAKAIGCPVIGTDLVGEISHGPWAGRIYGGQSVGADGAGTVLFVSKDRDADMTLVTLKRK